MTDRVEVPPARPGEEMSRSYPYLWISRRYGLDYGDVLSYADIPHAARLNYWQRRALRMVGPARDDDPQLDDHLDRAADLWDVAQQDGLQAALNWEFGIL